MSLKKNLGLRWFKMDFKLQPMTSPCLHCSSLTACRNANCRGGMSTVLHVLNNVLPWTPLPQLPYLMSYLGFGLDFCSAGDICNREVLFHSNEKAEPLNSLESITDGSVGQDAQTCRPTHKWENQLHTVDPWPVLTVLCTSLWAHTRTI